MKQTGPQKTVLLVDDNPANLRLLSRMLTARGHKVRAVTTGARALEAVRANAPDLILLDVMMPEMNGYEVCERLKADEQTRDIPIIFISALGETEDKVNAFAIGGVDYVTKPFQFREVLARVETHMALRELQKQLAAVNQELEKRNTELETRNAELQRALDTIKTLSGLIPICAWCGRKIQDDDGEWVRVENYIEARSEAKFSHGICPECYKGWVKEKP
jgi:DNA-binding response OmpR family regulator